MSLSGILEHVRLAEVIRLVAKARRSGLLWVSGEGIEGHVFFQHGQLVYATTRAEDTFLGDLVRMGLLGERDRVAVERRRVDLEDVLRTQAGRAQMREYLEEQIVEVLVRLLRLDRGSFEFHEGVAPRHATGQAFEPGPRLDEARARLAKWQEIERVIPGSDVRLRMAPEPGERPEVTLDRLSWKLLAALGTGASVNDLARRFGMWEFPTARKLARLAEDGLVEVIEPS